jgi:hypothetical protein
MSRPKAAEIRLAIQALCAKRGDRVSYAQIFRVFNLTDPDDKDRTRRKIGDFLKRGELQRVEKGVFTYHPEAIKPHQAQGLQRLWRAIRAEQPGWTTADLAQVSGMSRNHCQKYCRWLASEGFITPHGRDGNTKQWRVTTKGRDHRETPYPPRAVKDPFQAEKNAACRLVRCLMARDPGKPVTRKKIITECTTILARFTKGGANAQA